MKPKMKKLIDNAIEAETIIGVKIFKQNEAILKALEFLVWNAPHTWDDIDEKREETLDFINGVLEGKQKK